MRVPRIIPCLSLRGSGFVKTEKFKNPKYLGDPINIVKIFNEKEVDELMVVDIAATTEQQQIKWPLLKQLASECFMPVGYGGGVRNLDDVHQLFAIGFEKVSLSSSALSDRPLVEAAAARYGSQSIVATIDVRKTLFGSYDVVTHSGTKKRGLDPAVAAKSLADAGCGEIVVNSVDRDGTYEGYDLQLISLVANAVGVPVVALGGAKSLLNLIEAVEVGGASAAAAASFFVYHGPHRAVLINVPSPTEIKEEFRRFRAIGK